MEPHFKGNDPHGRHHCQYANKNAQPDQRQAPAHEYCPALIEQESGALLPPEQPIAQVTTFGTALHLQAQIALRPITKPPIRTVVAPTR